MAYKLLEAAQERWRRFNGHELIADVLNGAAFKDGVKVTDDETTMQDEENRRLTYLRRCQSTTLDNCSEPRHPARCSA